jgi:2-oxoglutarate dehydrogenase E2 component (dihydrolipoamide succinyltransferase)
MAQVNIILPAMGEGVIEATITKWLVSEGAKVAEEDPVVEVATDKVDTEIPAPSSGTLTRIIAAEGSVARIGEVIAVIEYEGETKLQDPEKVEKEVMRIRETIDSRKQEKNDLETISKSMASRTPSGKFISPLVRSIAAGEGISYFELDNITGTGMDGRITRDDILGYLSNRKREAMTLEPVKTEETSETEKDSPALTIKTSRGDEVIEMDRVRKIIADHMVMSKRTSPHVTSFIDVDVTGVVNWRNSIKEKFLEREGYKITLTPVFIDAAARALTDFPMVNISVEGTSIIKKRNINIGMATALPDGNLIVPVIKNANEKNLAGLAKAVNDLSERARNNRLKPDEITDGTFTVTNYGTYNNLAGTPIINQPQTAILGIGVVRKTPAVVETPDGDAIAIRQIVIISLSYDHRVIDGALAGKFLNRIKGILEKWTP